jgi:hypothetical protein
VGKTNPVETRALANVVVEEQEMVTNSASGPLLPLQSIEMKEATIQKAAKTANDDLDAYLASVRAYLARPDSRSGNPVLSQSSKSKSNKQWRGESAATESRASPATTKELAKKYYTKNRVSSQIQRFGTLEKKA